MEQKSQFLVRVSCMTYNQEPYITDALNGFVMQQTSLPFVCTIIDDASTDRNAEVIRNYVSENFDLQDTSIAYEKDMDYGHVTFARHKTNQNCYFAVIYLKENHYSQNKPKAPYIKEWADNVKYIALCEGDDYWTDPLKLQKQVDILESDMSLMAVVTNSSVVDSMGNQIRPKENNVVPNNCEGRYDLRSFIYKNHRYFTATVCYRATHVDEVKKMQRQMYNPYFGDWSLWIILHIFGDFYYLDQVTSAYRINPTSVTHTYDRIGRSKENWKINESLKLIIPDEYDDILKSLDDKTWMWIDLGYAYRHEHKYLRMWWCFFVAFVKNPKETIGDYKRRKQSKRQNKGNTI